jgi:hypothetical protein
MNNTNTTRWAHNHFCAGTWRKLIASEIDSSTPVLKRTCGSHVLAVRMPNTHGDFKHWCNYSSFTVLTILFFLSSACNTSCCSFVTRNINQYRRTAAMANSVFRSDLKTWVHHECVRYKDMELVLGPGAQGH